MIDSGYLFFDRTKTTKKRAIAFDVFGKNQTRRISLIFCSGWFQMTGLSGKKIRRVFFCQSLSGNCSSGLAKKQAGEQDLFAQEIMVLSDFSPASQRTSTRTEIRVSVSGIKPESAG